MKPAILIFLLAALCGAQPKPPRLAPPLNLLAPCRGQVTIAAFIVTTCSHCKAFTRDVMQPLYAHKQACAIAIAFNQDANTAQFAKDQHLTFPVVRLEHRVVQQFLGLTGPDRILGTPQVVVIDKAGKIQAQSVAEGSPLLLQANVIQNLVERLR